jgi:hypothetical protein
VAAPFGTTAYSVVLEPTTAYDAAMPPKVTLTTPVGEPATTVELSLTKPVPEIASPPGQARLCPWRGNPDVGVKLEIEAASADPRTSPNRAATPTTAARTPEKCPRMNHVLSNRWNCRWQTPYALRPAPSHFSSARQAGPRNWRKTTRIGSKQ